MRRHGAAGALPVVRHLAGASPYVNMSVIISRYQKAVLLGIGEFYYVKSIIEITLEGGGE
jgi:hypothetical protein